MTALIHALSLPAGRARRAALLLLSLSFVGIGALHFVRPDTFEAIVPPWLPAARLLVYVSGVCEILGGLGILLPATRRSAGWGLVALLVAVFPANLHMALEAEHFAATMGTPAWALYLRLPFQLVFIGWALYATRPEAGAPAPG